MFETTVALWDQYCSVHAPHWASSDPKHPLSAEVKNRLEQLDLILDHLHRALVEISPDPEVTRHNAAWVMEKGPLLGTGEISEADYIAGLRSELRDPRAYIRSWSEVRLFTECFYLIAWRVREILGMSIFQGLSVDVPGISQVRNLLIQHPEHGKPTPNYDQSLIVTDDGPVLKSSQVVVHQARGRTSAVPESTDQGLFLNAVAFRDAIERRIQRALLSST